MTIAGYDEKPGDPYYVGTGLVGAVNGVRTVFDQNTYRAGNTVAPANFAWAPDAPLAPLLAGGPVLDSNVQYQGTQVKQPGGGWQDVAVDMPHPTTASLIADMFPVPTMDNGDLVGGTGGSTAPVPAGSPGRFGNPNNFKANDVPDVTAGQTGNPIDFRHGLATVFTPDAGGGDGGGSGGGGGGGGSGGGGTGGGSGGGGSGTSTTPTDPINRLIDLVAAQYAGGGSSPADAGGVTALPTEIAGSGTSAAPMSSGAKLLLIGGLGALAFWWYKHHKKAA